MEYTKIWIVFYIHRVVHSTQEESEYNVRPWQHAGEESW